MSRYSVRCEPCGRYMRLDEGDIDSAVYECEKCGRRVMLTEAVA